MSATEAADELRRPTSPSPTSPSPTTSPTEPSGEQGKLMITAAGPDSAKAKEQSFVYTAAGPDNIRLTVAIVLRAGETSGSVVISRIPTGAYTVTEKRAWSRRYSNGNSKTTTVSADNTSKVVFDHKLNRFEWLNGYSNRIF